VPARPQYGVDAGILRARRAHLCFEEHSKSKGARLTKHTTHSFSAAAAKVSPIGSAMLLVLLSPCCACACGAAVVVLAGHRWKLPSPV